MTEGYSPYPSSTRKLKVCSPQSNLHLYLTRPASFCKHSSENLVKFPLYSVTSTRIVWACAGT